MGNWGEPKHHPDWVPTGTGNAPLQNHTTYITGWCDMVGALGAQFNGDPRLHFIDLSGGGAWGEYYWDDAWGVEITPANALTIAQATIAAFPDTYILAPATRPYMDNAIALAPNVGWRFDFAGGMPLTLAGTPMQDRWKTAPVVTEWAPDPASFTTALALDNVRSMHISMVSSGNKPLLTSAMTAPDRAVFEQAVRETGHRYTLTTLAVPHKATAGTTHTVTVTLRNDGVAPTYDTWRTDLVLTHATSGAAHTIPLSGVNARTCVGGGSVVSYDSTITLPAEPGWYQASVRITDVKTTYLPPARLANTGRDPSGAYPMGDLQILPSLEAPMTSITVLTTDWPALNPGGGGPVAGGAVPLGIVSPINGAWPAVTRVPGDRIMWLRHITAASLAPIPTSADGYREGDLVYPVTIAEETQLEGPGVVLSDSFNATSDTNIDGRYGDAYAGGAEPAWDGIIGGLDANARHRLQPGSGIELYSDAYATALTPKIPDRDRKYTFTLHSMGNGVAAVVIAGSAPNSGDRVTLSIHNNNGALRFYVEDRTTGTNVSTDIGTATYTAETIVTVTVIGRTVSCTYGGVSIGSLTFNSGAELLDQATLYAGQYASASFQNLIVETL